MQRAITSPLQILKLSLLQLMFLKQFHPRKEKLNLKKHIKSLLMATFQEQLSKSKKLTPIRLKNDLFKFIRSIEKDLLDLEKKRLSKDSEDIFGNPIGFYSEATEILSGGKKKAGDPFSGLDTGDWFKGFYMQEVSGVLRFSSTDPKNSIILSDGPDNTWLSDELFGLSDKDLKEVITSRLLPFFIENARNILEI